jgi:hypothetical protein
LPGDPAATEGQTPVQPDDKRTLPAPGGYFSFGLGGEANLLTVEGIGTGITATVEYRINRFVAAGTRATVSYDLKEIGALEIGVFGRFYFLAPPRVLNLFLGLDMGAAILRQAKEQQDPTLTTEIMAGLSLGLRIMIKNFYLEPYIRGGTPFLAGGGLMFGYSFK